jgi:hypothetical protein
MYILYLFFIIQFNHIHITLTNSTFINYLFEFFYFINRNKSTVTFLLRADLNFVYSCDYLCNWKNCILFDLFEQLIKFKGKLNNMWWTHFLDIYVFSFIMKFFQFNKQHVNYYIIADIYMII